MKIAPPSAPVGVRPASETRWLLLAIALFVTAALLNTWQWFVADRMPAGDFPGYVSEIQYVQQALLRYGHVPLWCSECYGGSADFMGHLKEYLAFPLSLWLGPVVAAKLLFVLLKCVAALGLYLVVARCLGWPGVGLVAGYAYGFGAVSNAQIQHLDLALATALLPLVVLAAVELFRTLRPGWAIALGVTIALQLVNNWVHAFSAPLLVLLLIGLRPWRAGGTGEAPWRDARLAARWGGLLGIALLVFVALAASGVAWILADASHHALFSPQVAATYRERFIQRSPFVFVNRDNVLAAWLAAHHPPRLDVAAAVGGDWYLGIVVLAVCGAGGIALRRNPGLRGWALAAATLAWLQYWMSLGPRTLLWEVATSLHWSAAWQLRVSQGLTTAAACCGAAALVVALSNTKARTKAGRGPSWRTLVGAGLLLLFPTLSLWNVAARLAPFLESQRSPGHYFDTAPLWIDLLFAVCLVALASRFRRPRARGVFLAIVALALVLDFWPSTRAYARGTPQRALDRWVALVEPLPGADGTLRVAEDPLYSPLNSWVASQSQAGLAWGWLYWQGSRDWVALMMAAFSSLRQADPERQRDGTTLLALARVRYFLLDARGGWRTALPPPWQALRSEGALSIWEQPHVSPMAQGYRSYAPAPGEARADAGNVVGAVRDGLLLVSSADGRLRLAGERPFELDYRRPGPEHIRLEIPPERNPAYVFVDEAYHPWWRARVDGRPAPVVRAQDAFMAVAVEPGAHTVDLVFAPPASVAVADGLTAAAWVALPLVALAAWAWPRLRRGRRGSRTDSQEPASPRIEHGGS